MSKRKAAASKSKTKLEMKSLELKEALWSKSNRQSCRTENPPVLGHINSAQTSTSVVCWLVGWYRHLQVFVFSPVTQDDIIHLNELLVNRESLTCNTSSIKDNCCFCHFYDGKIKKATLEEQRKDIWVGAQMFSLQFPHSTPLLSDPKTQTPARREPTQES